MSEMIGIEIDERTQGVWFVEMERGDFMAHIGTLPHGRIKLTWRFRYYKDEKPFDSQDEKNWYQAEGTDLAKGIHTVRLVVELAKRRPGSGKAYELLRGNLSVRDYMDLLLHQTFAHAKRISQAEYEAMQRK